MPHRPVHVEDTFGRAHESRRKVRRLPALSIARKHCRRTTIVRDPDGRALIRNESDWRNQLIRGEQLNRHDSCQTPGMGHFIWIYGIITVAVAALALLAMLKFENRPRAQRIRKIEQRLADRSTEIRDYTVRDGLRPG